MHPSSCKADVIHQNPLVVGRDGLSCIYFHEKSGCADHSGKNYDAAKAGREAGAATDP
jgi:hypothetical protein